MSVGTECAVTVALKRALSRIPAMIPDMYAAQFNWPISGGTETKVFVTGAFSCIISVKLKTYVSGDVESAIEI